MSVQVLFAVEEAVQQMVRHGPALAALLTLRQQGDRAFVGASSPWRTGIPVKTHEV